MADWRIGRGVAILVLIVASVAVSACASSRAQVLEDQPTLAVPPVPPRSIEPPAIVEPPPVEPLPEVALPPATTAKPAPRPGNRTTDNRPESKPEPPAESTPPPTTNPAPVAPLRTPNTPSGPDAARQIKDMLDSAAGVLKRVDYQRLSDDRKANYRAAQSFVEQGLAALKRDDLSLARSFAVRAEDIARQLEPSGRK
jgi:hypothetical protein